MMRKILILCLIAVSYTHLDESGTRVPVLQGGFNNYFGYRSFSLTVNFSYSIGNKIRLLRIASGEYSAVSPKPMQNLRREFMNRWRNPGAVSYTHLDVYKRQR